MHVCECDACETQPFAHRCKFEVALVEACRLLREHGRFDPYTGHQNDDVVEFLRATTGTAETWKAE